MVDLYITTRYNRAAAGVKNRVNVNDFFVKESKLALIIAGLVFLIGTSTLIYYLPIFILKYGGLYSSLGAAGLLLIPGINIQIF